MHISSQAVQPDIVLLCPDGRLDAANSQQLKETIRRLIFQDTRKLIIDLEKVPFIDSSGLVALVSGLRLMRQKNGHIFLSGIQPQAQAVFRLTMLDHIFPIHPTIHDAKEGLR
jgi:anti-sigma B factor antagonist